MRLDLSPQQLAFLYPAFIIVDAAHRVAECGPALRDCAPAMLGGLLDDHFDLMAPGQGDLLAGKADRCEPVHLRLRGGDLSLIGAVLRVEQGFLLALDVMPLVNPAAETRLSDFAPDDPAATLQLVVRMQHAFLAEAREAAETMIHQQEKTETVLEGAFRASGTIGHDLNNLLSIVSLNANMTKARYPDDADLARAVSRINAACVQGSIVARSLLALARHGADRTVTVEADQVITSQQDFLAAVCGAEMRLVLDLAAPGAMIDVVRPGLINGLINLLSNAREASSNGSSIRIVTRCFHGAHPVRPSEDARLLSIEVSDEGAGMPSDVLERAFDPFYSTKNRGSGLGLVSVREFVEAMDGSVTAVSRKGEGTQIILTLPCRMRSDD